MPKLRVAVDANVVLSAFLFRGVPRQVISSAALYPFQSITAESIIKEVEQKLRVRFGKSDAEVAHVLKILRRVSLIVEPRESVFICRDPRDNHILECAAAGQADVIVTGDRTCSHCLHSEASASSRNASS